MVDLYFTAAQVKPAMYLLSDAPESCSRVEARGHSDGVCVGSCITLVLWGKN